MKKLSDDVIKYVMTASLDRSKLMWDQQFLIHKAYTVMLMEQKLITSSNGQEILEVLSTLQKKGFSALKLDTSEDLYMNIEKYVIDQIGYSGSNMHLGRSRNDLYATASRMLIREKVNEVTEALINLREALVALAGSHIDTVMPGYTHWQIAQPVTFAHYLMGIGDAIGRDIERVENAYGNTNRSPMGASALATTSYPIDRLRIAELLGFDGLVENSYDAVASRDFIAEIASDLAIAVLNINRLVEDMLVFSSCEFSSVQMADEYCGISSIMPQKRNPFVLEHCRAKTGHVIGDLMAILAIVKGIPFAHCRDTADEILKPLLNAIDQTLGLVRILKGAMSTLIVNSKLLLERSKKGFSTATDIADLLVRKKGLPFRISHKIVGSLVKVALKQGKLPSEITVEMLDKVAIRIIGKPVNLSKKDLAQALDPSTSVKVRNVIGGPAPIEVKRMMDVRKKEICTHRANLKRRRLKVEISIKKLDNLVTTNKSI